jgi:2,3-bisphosphoglycerate-independent phosphoglycerate mutase
MMINFATVDENLNIIDRRAGRIDKTESLSKSLSDKKIEGVKFFVKSSHGHRAVLIMSGKNLSSKISANDPNKTGIPPLKVLPQDESEKAKFTAKVLNEFLGWSHQKLKSHELNKERANKGLFPANYLLMRGAGEMEKVPSFKKMYGLKAVCIAGGDLYKGVARILGMDEISVKGATGLSNTNLEGKILAAKKALKKYDFVFLHIKAADTFAHDGDYLGKKNFIEKIDKELKILLELKDTLIIVTSDHSTCCNLKEHCKEPIPILIYGNGVDEISQFSEKECKNGKLGEINQIEVMQKILEFCKNKN